jgi:rhodanese-related sulfurtransferase
VLAGARSRLRRLTPAAAIRARDAGAVVVDIRPASQRQAEGGPDDVLVIERNVLEWRFDPASAARLAIADYDLQVILLCQEGYASSLAAAAVQDLGVWRATDVIGGWDAWRRGLPE